MFGLNNNFCEVCGQQITDRNRLVLAKQLADNQNFYILHSAIHQGPLGEFGQYMQACNLEHAAVLSRQRKDVVVLLVNIDNQEVVEKYNSDNNGNQ